MKKLMFVFMALFLIGFINAAPPVTTVQQFSNGYEIKTPTDNIWLTTRDVEVEIHVYNISDGVPIISGIQCYFHLYNSTGQHVLELTDNVPSHLFDYTFLVGKTNISRELKTYVVQCNSTNLGGYKEVELIINDIGLETNEGISDSINRGVWVLLVLAILFFIAFLYNNTPVVKYSFLLLFVIFLMLSINITFISIYNEMGDVGIGAIYDKLAAFSMYMFWFAFGLLVIMWVFTTLASLADRREAKKMGDTGNLW